MPAPIEIADRVGSPSLVLTGSVNIRNAAEMWRAVEQLIQHDGDITVDCGQASYLDCSILQQVLMLRANASNVRMENVSGSLADDMRLVGCSDGGEP